LSDDQNRSLAAAVFLFDGFAISGGYPLGRCQSAKLARVVSPIAPIHDMILSSMRTAKARRSEDFVMPVYFRNI
jgi:hypothetical protein